MRWLVVLVALFLAGCGNRSDPFDRDIVNARQWLRNEQFGRLLGQVDGWLQAAEQRRDVKTAWQFRLAKAAAMLNGERSAEEALKLLTSHGEIPTGKEWAAEPAEWFILRARAAYSLGQLRDVPVLLDRATRAASEANRPDLAAEAEFRRGFLLRDEGRFPEARSKFNAALAASRRLHDRRLEAQVVNNLGTLLVSESRHDEAIPLLESSRAIAREIGAPDTAARAEGNLGIVWLRLGDYENALACFDAAKAEFARVGNQFEVQIWTGNTGNVFYDTGDIQTALSFYQRAFGIARRVGAPVWEGRWLTDLASIAIERADWDAAERYNNDARAVKARTNDKQYEASSLINAAQIAAGRGDLAGAISLFNDALRRNAEDPTAVLEGHMGLAGVYSRQGLQNEAKSEFRNTVAQIENRQSKLFKDEYRLSWLASLVRFYQKYVDFLVLQNEPDHALEAAESSRSKVLSSQPISQIPVSGYRQLARRTGFVLLEYLIGPEHSYLWVVTPEKIFFHVLPPKAELLPLIRSYRAVVTAGRNPLDVAPEAGSKLYDALLAPAMKDAPSATQFVVVPDDELHTLNFETLPDGGNSNRFWIDRATVRIAPSLNYLAAATRAVRARPAPRMLVIGDPVAPLPQYPHLEFAGQEISAIRNTMSGAQPVVVQGAAATPESYAASRPGDYSYIHFSAHAAAAAKQESALDSAVILSGPPGHYRLAARTVLAIPLKAELVTVSACRSAGGRTYGGEGLVGFAWAFMKAGAGNVIAGLWDVNDQSTVRLMTGLYSEIAKGVPPAEALRASKLALIHGGGAYARPFYWAPFQIFTARP